MPNFWFKARIEYDGADVLVEAATEEEARAKAEAGEWEHDDLSGASLVNWTISKQRAGT